MSILRLPDELLQELAGFLDQNARASFALAHPRLLSATIDLMKTINVRVLDPFVSDYLKIHGFSVRSLTLSTCAAFLPCLNRITAECPHLVELNLLNVSVTFPALRNILGELRELEKLNVSMLSVPPMTAFYEHRTDGRVFPSIRTLHVEVSPVNWSIEMLIDLLNRFKSIESVHVTLIGRETGALSAPDHLSQVPRRRWMSLQRFVLSVSLSASLKFPYFLLKRVFGHIEEQRIRHWLLQERETYIYENGWLNGERIHDLDAESSFELLRLADHISLRESDILDDPSTVASGLPQQLRLNIFGSSLKISDIFKSYASEISSLVELDLSDCHGMLPEATQVKFFAACRILEALAVPHCFILGPRDRSNTQDLALVMQKMKLKRLFLKGNLERANFQRSSSRRDIFCVKCAETLGQKNLPSLSDLKHLEELTFNYVHASAAAYHDMVNPRVRIIRLTLNTKSGVEGLQDFVSQCKNLEGLKLAAADLDLNSVGLWDALTRCKSLKQLCLTSGIMFDSDAREVRESFFELHNRLELLHLHAMKSESLTTDIQGHSPSGPCSGKCSGLMCSSMDTLQFSEEPVVGPGRNLCYSESLIGQIKPEGWD